MVLLIHLKMKEGLDMLSYRKLFALLALRNIKAYELQQQIKTSAATMAKLKKGDTVNTAIIQSICKYLNVQPGDIMEYLPDQNEQQ